MEEEPILDRDLIVTKITKANKELTDAFISQRLALIAAAINLPIAAAGYASGNANGMILINAAVAGAAIIYSITSTCAIARAHRRNNNLTKDYWAAR